MRCKPGSASCVFIHWSYVGAGVPWQHTSIWVPPAPAPVAPTTTPRKFVALSRTVHEYGHTIDAIDDDGVAWWMVIGSGDFPDVEWTQMRPLPAREVQADA